MKFETIRNNKKKVKITLGIVGEIVVIGVTAFTLTRANYKQTQSVPLIKGSISYNKSDLEIVAIKLQQDDGTYSDVNEIPTSGYKLNEDMSKSYCKVGDKTNKASYTYAGGTWFINTKEKGSKCYLTFDKGNITIDNLVEDILIANGGKAAIKAKGNPDFSKTSCTPGTYNGHNETCGEDTTGLWAMEDDDGTSYYFRGSPTNNYVKFGGFYWRIIRINGDGTIRLIYDGSEYHQNGTRTQDSLALSHLYSKSWNHYNNNAYVGYTYKEGVKRGTGTSNGAKTGLETWYTSSGLSNYSGYLADSGFCGDRTSTAVNGGVPNNSGGTGIDPTYYGAYYRLEINKMPTLRCATISYGTSSSYEKGNKADVYTKDSSKGNGQLTYPIGLITADELAIAGAVNEISNTANYLYNGSTYWTMSPHTATGTSSVWVMNEDYLDDYAVDNEEGLRPVINIDPTKINNITIDSNGVYVIS